MFEISNLSSGSLFSLKALLTISSMFAIDTGFRLDLLLSLLLRIVSYNCDL